MAIIPANVKQALDLVKTSGGAVKFNTVNVLVEWAQKDGENAKHVLDFCTSLIAELKKTYRTAFIDDVYFIRGLMKETLGQYDEAISDFTVATKMFIDANGALFERGKVYYLKGEYDKALKDLNLVIARDKTNGDYYYYRGLVCKAQGKEDLAAKDLEKALSMAK